MIKLLSRRVLYTVFHRVQRRSWQWQEIGQVPGDTLLDPDGEMKPSAMHRLLAQNGNNKQFFGGRYHPANRKTVPHLGQEAIVMTDADFNAIKAPLTDSLELTSKHPFENGLYIRDNGPTLIGGPGPYDPWGYLCPRTPCNHRVIVCAAERSRAG